jgi:hypothetical protein
VRPLPSPICCSRDARLPPARPSLLPAGLLPWLFAVLVTAGLSAGCSETAPVPGSGTRAAAGAASFQAGPARGEGPETPLPAAEVLGSWDRARARAFATGDLAALRALYRPGSAAGTADVRLFRAYRARGLRIEGMRMQLLGVEVLHEGPHRLRLRVTDRLAAAVAVGDGLRVPLPRDAASTRVVELRRRAAGARWQVSEVRTAPRRAAR